jgi:energy-coupling factor transporter ATP-binding protein EcfA2
MLTVGHTGVGKSQVSNHGAGLIAGSNSSIVLTGPTATDTGSTVDIRQYPTQSRRSHRLRVIAQSVFQADFRGPRDGPPTRRRGQGDRQLRPRTVERTCDIGRRTVVPTIANAFSRLFPTPRPPCMDAFGLPSSFHFATLMPPRMGVHIPLIPKLRVNSRARSERSGDTLNVRIRRAIRKLACGSS